MHKKTLLSFLVLLLLSQHSFVISNNTTQETPSLHTIEDQNSATPEIPSGYDALAITCQNVEQNYQASSSLQIPDWVSNAFIAVLLKYYDMKEFVGYYWHRIKQSVSHKKIKN